MTRRRRFELNFRICGLSKKEIVLSFTRHVPQGSTSGCHKDFLVSQRYGMVDTGWEKVPQGEKRKGFLFIGILSRLFFSLLSGYCISSISWFSPTLKVLKTFLDDALLRSVKVRGYVSIQCRNFIPIYRGLLLKTMYSFVLPSLLAVHLLHPLNCHLCLLSISYFKSVTNGLERVFRKSLQNIVNVQYDTGTVQRFSLFILMTCKKKSNFQRK